MWNEIVNPFPNFKGYTVEVWEWKSNYIPHFITDVITYPHWDVSWSNKLKKGHNACTDPRPLFTKRTGVLPPNLVKSRSREIGCYNDHIALKFWQASRQCCCGGARQILERLEHFNPNLAAWRSCVKTSNRFVNRGPTSCLILSGVVHLLLLFSEQVPTILVLPLSE